MKLDTRKLTRAAAIAAIYVASCLALAPISYGSIQIRVAEALTMLPMIWPEAVPGLAIGALIANLLGPVGAIDVIFGTMATIMAALITLKYKWRPIGYAAPIVLNGIIVGGYLPFVYGMPEVVIWGFNLTVEASMLAVAAGEAVAVLLLGIPLLNLLKKVGNERK